MSSLIKLFRLLYPFLQEFGLKEVNIKDFIIQNKTISYLFAICLILFILLLYAFEQAHLRMLYRVVLVTEQTQLKTEIDSRDKQIEQLQILCDKTDNISKDNGPDIEDALNEIMGKENEK